MPNCINPQKITEELESIMLNDDSYLEYYDAIKEIVISSFKWINLPDTIDSSVMERWLCDTGMSIFFKDSDLGYLSLICELNGELNPYGIATRRGALSENNAHFSDLNDKNSVIIFNNIRRTTSIPSIKYYARKLWLIDRTADINLYAQRTPVIILTNNKNLRTMQEFYMKYSGFIPFIFADENSGLEERIKSIDTHAEFTADKIWELRNKTWNDMLTRFGVVNINEKKERYITAETNIGQGGTYIFRASRLNARLKACEEINKMFGLNISVEFNEFKEIPEIPNPEEGELNE